MDTVENQSVEQIAAKLKAASPAELNRFASSVSVKLSKNQDTDRHRLAQAYYDSAIWYIRREKLVMATETISSFGLLKLFAKRRTEYNDLAGKLVFDDNELIYRRLLYKMALMADCIIEIPFPSLGNLAKAQSQSIENYLHAAMLCYFYGNLAEHPQRIRYEVEQYLQAILMKPAHDSDAMEHAATLIKILEMKIETTEKIDSRGLTFSKIAIDAGKILGSVYNHTGTMDLEMFQFKVPLATWILININRKLRLFAQKTESDV